MIYNNVRAYIIILFLVDCMIVFFQECFNRVSYG